MTVPVMAGAVPVMAGAVLVLSSDAALVSAPPGVDRAAWWRALVEDTVDVLAGLAAIRVVVAVGPDVDAEAVRALTWPSTPVVRLPAGLTADTHLIATLDALTALGAGLGVVVAADSPDLPGMLVGKLLSALEDAPLAVSPARGGGLCGLGSRLPPPEWLRTAHLDLDAADALERLHAAAPEGAVVVGPGWHRLRAPADIGHLDANLEGWDATRALLSGR